MTFMFKLKFLLYMTFLSEKGRYSVLVSALVFGARSPGFESCQGLDIFSAADVSTRSEARLQC